MARERDGGRIGLRDRLDNIRRAAIIPKDLELTKPDYPPTAFAGQTSLITGVSHFGGFGYETARKLVEMGAGAVAINYRKITDEVNDIVADLKERARQTGTRIIPIKADISRIDEAASLVRMVVSRTGRLDVYIDNAGRIAMGKLAEQTAEDVVENSMTNIVGPQIILGEAFKQMKAGGGGRVVSILSIAADGVPFQSQYAGAKAFKFAAARSGAMESLLTRSRITFVSIAPSLSPTTMTSVVGEDARPALMEMVGQKQEVSPSDVADYIVYAASSLVPDTLNGQVIPVYKPMQSLQAPAAQGAIS